MASFAAYQRSISPSDEDKSFPGTILAYFSISSNLLISESLLAHSSLQNHFPSKNTPSDFVNLTSQLPFSFSFSSSFS